jgi:hypothetical protein
LKFVSIERRLAKEYRFESVLAMTNMHWAEHWLRPKSGAVIGPERLAELLDESPAVQRRVPSLLGIRELPEPANGSSWDRDAACALSQVFVPTHAYRSALRVLERHRFAVLSGPPEMGKTAIARTLGLALQDEGWEVHECIRPEQIWEAHAPDRAQLFVADDAFGSTEYRPDSAERWALELDRILRVMDERHWLVWTSRPAPLKAGLGRIHREHGVERFPRPGEVYVDAANLDIEEKALILYRHARAADLLPNAIAVVREHGPAIVRHRYFTPERINRFVRTRLRSLVGVRSLRMAISAEIAEPTDAMAASLDALTAEHRALLVALVDAPNGPVPERELAAAARRHAPGGLSRSPAELVDRLTDHFLRVVPPTSVTWVHPSWRDLVIERLAADPGARRRFLERCSLEGVLLALSRAGGRSGERFRPLLGEDGDWDALDRRLYELIPELDDSDVLRLIATLEDLLSLDDDPDAAEVIAITTTALRGLRSCWERGDSLASYALLERWFALSRLLDEPPAPPHAHKLWDPPPAPMPTPSVPLTDAVGRAVWTEDAEDMIVTRILADL